MSSGCGQSSLAVPGNKIMNCSPLALGTYALERMPAPYHSRSDEPGGLDNWNIALKAENCNVSLFLHLALLNYSRNVLK
jgi:hypothetical protein